MMFEDHAFYIWTSYAITAAVLIWQVWQPALRMRRVRARLAEETIDDTQT